MCFDRYKDLKVSVVGILDFDLVPAFYFINLNKMETLIYIFISLVYKKLRLDNILGQLCSHVAAKSAKELSKGA